MACSKSGSCNALTSVSFQESLIKKTEIKVGNRIMFFRNSDDCNTAISVTFSIALVTICSSSELETL